MRNDDRVTHDLVTALFTYDAYEGVFRYRIQTGKMKKGSIAGSRKKNGYVILSVRGLFFHAARVAWLYVYGEWPKNTIDHINRIRFDNRISNLRDVTSQVNSFNIGMSRTNNKSGYVGVHLNTRSNRYYAQIQCKGKNIYLGSFIQAEDASNAYMQAKSKLHAISA